LSTRCIIDVESVFARHKLSNFAAIPSNLANRKDQYKKKLQKWGLRKRIEGPEYDAILALESQHQQENPNVTTRYLFGNREVIPANLARYKMRVSRLRRSSDDTNEPVGKCF